MSRHLIIRRKIMSVTRVPGVAGSTEANLVCGHKIKLGDYEQEVDFSELVECVDCLVALTGRRRQPVSMSMAGLKKAVALRINKLRGRPIKETISDTP